MYQALRDCRLVVFIAFDRLRILSKIDHQFIGDIRIHISEARFDPLCREDAWGRVLADCLDGVAALSHSAEDSKKEQQRGDRNCKQRGLQQAWGSPARTRRDRLYSDSSQGGQLLTAYTVQY